MIIEFRRTRAEVLSRNSARDKALTAVNNRRSSSGKLSPDQWPSDECCGRGKQGGCFAKAALPIIIYSEPMSGIDVGSVASISGTGFAKAALRKLGAEAPD